VVIWAGDADWVCDYMGGEAVTNEIEFSGHEEFKNKELSNYTVNGVVGGLYKNVDNLSWLRVYESGHYVPYFRKFCSC